MSAHSYTFIIAALIVLIANAWAFGDWKEDAIPMDISGGEDHTLVLTKNGYVWACGDNYYYQLGIGSNVSKWTLVRVAKGDMNSTSDYLENIDDVDAGWTHSLAVDVNGLICAWGRNREGQLGDNQRSGYESLAPVRVRGVDDEGYLDDIVAISAGRSGLHSLAVDANGYGYGWGYNKYGQCGNDVNDCNEWTPVRVHQGVQPDDADDANDWLKHIVDICAGADQSIAVEKDEPSDSNFKGCVYTWGTNRWGDEDYEQGWITEGYGLLGTGSNIDLKDTPVKVLCGEQHPDDPNQPYLNHIVAVTAGWDHCLALEKDDPYDPNIYNPTYTGQVYAWGNNGRGYGGGHYAEEWEASVGGRLGNGSYDSNSTPVLVLSGEQDPNDPNSYLEHIIAISAGEGHSMALDANGYVYCWGDNQYGQLGNGRNDPCSVPVRVIAAMQNPEEPNSPLSRIVAISAGHWHSLAIDSNGVVWVWGKTKDGRLGLANMANAYPYYSSIPHRIPVVYNQTQETFAFGMQAAVTGADDGDLLMASAGTYYENVEVFDTNITLESMDPNNGDVVADTIIDAHYNNANSYTVDFDNGSDCTFAGFTLTNGTYAALYCGGSSSVNITDCRIENNAGWVGIHVDASSASITDSRIQNNGSPTSSVYGIYCGNGSAVCITDCNIARNTAAGIYCLYSSLRLTNSMIQDNGDHGIYDYNSADASVIANNIIRGNADNGIYSERFSSGPQIKNNWIYSNGGSGIETCNPSAPPDSNAAIANNTIVTNDEYGIKSDYAADVNITNCIIWDNGTEELYAGDSGTFDVTYSCVEGTPLYSGPGNINSDPCFIDAEGNDFHLDGNSLCIDAGDPGFEADANETDIDGELRVMDGDANDTLVVDMGADEFYWSPADFNGDGIVNFLDYAMLAWHWHETDVNGGDNDVFDLADNNAIDFGDILAFCDEWLWQAGWVTGPMPLMGGRGGAGMVEGLGLDAGLSTVAVAEREPVVAEPVDIEAIMKWLAEIWLDPDVQKSIDEEQFLKVYESLKKLSNQ